MGNCHSTQRPVHPPVYGRFEVGNAKQRKPRQPTRKDGVGAVMPGPTPIVVPQQEVQNTDYGNRQDKYTSKGKQAQAHSKPTPAHHGQPAPDAGAREHRPPAHKQGPQEHSERPPESSHEYRNIPAESRKGRGRPQDRSSPQKEQTRPPPPRQETDPPQEPKPDRRPHPQGRSPAPDQEPKPASPQPDHPSQKGERNPPHPRSTSPPLSKRKAKSSHSPPHPHSYPHNDTRFPPPNTPSPHHLHLPTKDGAHLTYNLLYQNTDPALSQQATAFLSAAKAFRHTLPTDLDREALIKAALQERKGIRRVSEGPRGSIWQVDRGETRLVACLLGMKGVVVSKAGRRERFDLFGEGLGEVAGEVLLVSRRVGG